MTGCTNASRRIKEEPRGTVQSFAVAHEGQHQCSNEPHASRPGLLLWSTHAQDPGAERYPLFRPCWAPLLSCTRTRGWSHSTSTPISKPLAIVPRGDSAGTKELRGTSKGQREEETTPAQPEIITDRCIPHPGLIWTDRLLPALLRPAKDACDHSRDPQTCRA